MKKEFIKGNDAITRAALLAGCTHFYGYPITPTNEIIQSVANIFPTVGATFMQAESEVAAINMCYGASSTGHRVMTASSGPGISLKQEGVSYLASAELPCVIIDVMRSGPGLGNIWPEQSDYNQVVKGGGHGNYKTPVLVPNCPQEMCDLTIKAFEIADKYRTPVYVLSDAYTGQVMEPVTFPGKVLKNPKKDWAIYADQDSKSNLVTSIKMDPKSMEDVNIMLQEKYKQISENEVQFSEYLVDDAEVVLIAYGISSRITKSAIDVLRDKGIKAGLLRPITVFPFPTKRIQELIKQVKLFSCVELSNGQMVDDVKLAVDGKCPVGFYGRMGGATPKDDEIVDYIEALLKKENLD